MKTRLLACLIFLGLTSFYSSAFGQAPNVSYGTSPATYPVGVAMTLTPTNSGGAVDPINYGTQAALTGTTFSGPTGISIDPSGNLYIPNFTSTIIRKYNSTQAYQGTFGTGKTITSPNAIAFDPSGNAYIVDTGNGQVYKYNSSGVYQSAITGFSHPLGLDVDASGNVYVADYTQVGTNGSSNNVIKKYSPAGALLLTINSAASGLDGVVVDASGNIYALGRFSNNVIKYSSTGALIGTIVTGLNGPLAISVDQYGVLIVGDSGNNLVKFYSQTGTFYKSIAVTDPEGIVADSQGNLFVANFGGNAVYRLPTTGAYTLTGTLPAGLTFNSFTGVISGTPTAATVAGGNALTITTYNGVSSNTASITLIIAPPVVTISGLNSTTTNGITPGTLSLNQTGIVLFGFSVAVTGAPTTLNSITLNAATGITNTITSYFGLSTFKLYRNTGTDYNAGTNTLDATATFTGGGATLTISGIGDAIPVGTTANYYVVANYNTAGALASSEQFSYTNNNANYTSGSSNATATSTPGNATVTGNAFILPAPNLLFTGINVTGPSPGNGITSPTTLPYNTSNVVLYGFSLTDANSPTTVTQVNLSTNNPSTDFFTNLRVYSSPTSTYNSGTATLLTTVTPASGNTAFNITGLSEALALNQTKYYFVVGDYNKVGNVLNTGPGYTTMRFDYSDMFQSVTNATKSTSNTTGQTFSLQNPIVTISNYNTGTYSGTSVSPGATYNLLGFNLSYSGPTNMHELNLDVSYPSGGPTFTSGYISSIDVVDASTGTRPAYITYVNNNGGNIAIGFNINSPQSVSTNYYLKVTFASSFTPNGPTAFNICLNAASNVTSNVCGNNSNCILVNNYNNLTGSSCSKTFGPAPTISYTTPQVFLVGTAIATLNPTTTGSPTSYSTTGLPAGLNLNTVTGAITGTPTAITPATDYFVTATNAYGTATATINITVNVPPSISYATPQTYYVGNTIAPLSPTNTGSAVGSYATPTTFKNITQSNGVAVNPATGYVYVTSTNNNAVYIYNSAGTLLFTQTGAPYNYNAPAGIIVDAAGSTYVANRNAGTVVKTTTANVVTTITGFVEPTALTMDAAGNIYVVDRNSSVTNGGAIYKLTSASTTAGTAYITNLNTPWGITVNNAGDLFVSVPGPGNSVNAIYKYAAGSTMQTTLVTPNTGLSSPRNMFIDAQGNIIESDAGITVAARAINLINSATGTITQLIATPADSPTAVATDGSGNLYFSGYNFGTIYKAVATGYSISGTLPAGLYFNNFNGTISGTPTATSPATNYTVTATNTYGTSSTVVNITVVNPPAPTVATVSRCGAGTVTLTASGSLPAGGTYNWYATNTSVTPLASTASYSPFVGGTTIFYVSYTVGTVTTARTAATATVNPLAASSINSPMLSYPFESGSLTDWSGLGNNGTLQGTTLPTATADRNGVANNAYLFNGTNSQYISTTTQYIPLVYSYSIWFKTTVGGGKLIGIGGNQTGSNSTHDRNLYMSNTGQLYYGVYNATTVTINTTTTYIDGLWHHAVVTDGPTNGMRIYVDGTLQAFTNTYTVPQQIAEYWRIGGDNLFGWPNRPSNDYFTGTLDDVAIYNHELTPAEAASNDMNLYKFSGGYCANNPLTITAQTLPGATYTWVDNATPVLTGTGNPVTFSSAGATNYTLTTTVNGCTQNTAIVTPATQTYTWTGAGGTTAMANNLNWTNTSTGIAGTAGSGAPTYTGTETIVIPAGASTYPVMTSSLSIYSLTMGNAATLTLNGNTLSVGCNIFNSAGGQILYGPGALASASANTSGITWNGSGTIANQGFTGSTTAGTTQVGTMTVNNTVTNGKVTINSGSLDIYYYLAMTAGNLAVTSPAVMTLKSNASQSANVGQIPSTYSITGFVNVERFITGGGLSTNRGYRVLSSPVNQTSPTSSLTNTFNIDYLNGLTFNNISYPGAYTGGLLGTSAGFSTTSVGPTINLFDERKVGNNKAYSAGKNIGVTRVTTLGPTSGATTGTIDLTDGSSSLYIPVGNALQMFFIGPSTRANSSSATLPADATLTAIGYLNQQNVTVNLWYAPTGGTIGNGKLSYTSTLTDGLSGFNMVGNPYASTINLATVFSDNTGNIDNIYLLNAKGYPNQKFVAYTPSGTSAPSAGYAISGEGFFVHATGTGKALTFKEGEKSQVQLTGAALIMSTPKGEALTADGLTTAPRSFKTLATNATTQATDEALTGLYMKIEKDTAVYNYCGIYFGSEWSKNFQVGDARDLDGNTPLVTMSSFSADGVRSAVKHFPDYRQGARIKLFADSKTDGMYTLKIEGIRNIDTTNYKITLLDHYKKDSLDIGRYKSYAFNILKSDTTTSGANRFELVINQLPGSKYQLATFTAQKASDGVLVTWRAYNEGNNYAYTLEKQDANGTAYNPVYQIQSNGGNIYKYTDKTPNAGNNVYRLKQIDLFGNITYAGPVNIYYDKSGVASMFTLYPNPTVETLNILVTNGQTTTAASTYKLNIYDATGMLVMQKTSANINWAENVSQFNPGIYIAELKDSSGKSLGKAKFVKK